jgi:hypothetical protein
VTPILFAVSPALLAPGPQELDAAVAEMHARVARMEALEVAVGRLQDAWGERLAAGGKLEPCKNAEAGSLVARSRVFGAAYRDAVQASRAELERLEYLWAAPTIVPLLDPNDLSGADALRSTVAEHVRIVLEAEAWQSRQVDPLVKCEVHLGPEPGIAYTGAKSLANQHQVAIIGVGGGIVCPNNEPADGHVVLTDGRACIGSLDCSCDPFRVNPGAVIGPTIVTPVTP